MIKRLAILSFILVFLQSAAWSPLKLFKLSNGSISFRSDATLELIKAASIELKGIFDSEKKQFAFSIPIKSFKGFNSPLQQEHFNENYLESDKYKDATFGGKIIEDIDYSIDGAYEIRAKGPLTIHNVTQDRIIKCNLVIRNKVISLKSNFTVLLADHNITIPKVVHEKLATEIKVEVKAEMAAQ